MATSQRVGFIGLGGMGSCMAANVLKGGFPLMVYNRDQKRTASLAAVGARVAATPRELAGHCDVVLIMVSDPSAVQAVLNGEDGFLAGAGDGLVLIDMSTVGPADVRTTLQHAASKGVRVLNAPVLGSLVPAEKGELTILAGGDSALVDAQRPLLSTMGTTIHYLGSNERAVSMKLAMNALLLGSQALFGEVVLLATRWGIPREQVLELFGPMLSPALKGRVGAMFADDAPASFALALGRKDLWLAVNAAYEAGAVVPITAATLELYSMATRDHGTEDIARIAAFLEEMSS